MRRITEKVSITNVLVQNISIQLFNTPIVGHVRPPWTIFILDMHWQTFSAWWWYKL